MNRIQTTTTKLILSIVLASPLAISSANARAVSTMSSQTSIQAPCIGIYHDRSAIEGYWMGKTYSQMTQNLLGHFPKYQQVVGAIEDYQSGYLQLCKANIYIGSYFANPLPKAFIEDLRKSKNSLLWMGYNIWQLSKDEQAEIFGLEYQRLTTLDKVPAERGSAQGSFVENIRTKSSSLQKNEPGFFKFFEYKGQEFFKFGKFRSRSGSGSGSDTGDEFITAFEMAQVKPLEQTKVLARAKHSTSGEKLPYLLQKKKNFYLADIPFSFIHEADRYLIFADVLFDLLEEKPLRKEKIAMIRIEDIHPLIPLSYLWTARDLFQAEKVPLNISLIPIFFDPLFHYPRETNEEMLALHQKPEFVSYLKEVQKDGGSLIWHGVTHQIDTVTNPHSGVSGDDFEFWNANENKPLTNDSMPWAMDRLALGHSDLQKAGLNPLSWLTPHYQASPQNYFVFGNIFPWNIGRVIYYNLNHLHTDLLRAFSKKNLQFGLNETEQSYESRRKNFENLHFDVDLKNQWSGQFYPYEIYGDVYGQRILPENLGNSQPIENSHVVQPRSVDDIIADAKRNSVLRDVWGSLFYHVQLFNTEAHEGRGRYPGDPAELQKIMSEMKKMGYRFVSVDSFIKQSGNPKRPASVDLSYLKNILKKGATP